jgi:hypothetical protein
MYLNMILVLFCRALVHALALKMNGYSKQTFGMTSTVAFLNIESPGKITCGDIVSEFSKLFREYSNKEQVPSRNLARQ